VFGKVCDRWPVNSCGPLLAQHFAGRAEEVQLAKHLVNQRVPFSSSHLVFQKCRQHAIRPNRSLSPPVDTRRLSSRCSRERHCDWDVVPPRGGFPFLRLGHLASTFLLPFAPPRFAARLHRYYESSDFCRAASSAVAGIATFAPCRSAILCRRAWAIDQAVSLAARVDGSSSASCTRQISLLIAFELPSLPSPTTALPFRHGRFITLHHRRDLPRLSPGEIQRIKGFARRAVKGSHIPSRLPDRLGRIEFTCVADWSFSSGCSPPSLTGTQLPLLDSGR